MDSKLAKHIIFVQMRSKILGLVIIVLLLAACKQDAKKEKVFKGYIIWDKDYTTFINCEADKTYWVDDKTKEIEAKYKQLATSPYQEVYFEVEADLLPPSTTGVSSGFDNILAVKNIVQAQKETPQNACATAKGKPVFSCFGENPKWTFGFGNDIKFTASYPKDTFVFFPLKEPQIRDSANVGRVFYYNIGNENYQNIQLIVMEQPCKIDKKFYRFTSKVYFGGEEYNGCAKIKMINDEEYSTD